MTLASSKWNDEVLPGISDSPQSERWELLEDVLCCWNVSLARGLSPSFLDVQRALLYYLDSVRF